MTPTEREAAKHQARKALVDLLAAIQDLQTRLNAMYLDDETRQSLAIMGYRAGTVHGLFLANAMTPAKKGGVA